MQNMPNYMDMSRDNFKYPQLTPPFTFKSNMWIS